MTEQDWWEHITSAADMGPFADWLSEVAGEDGRAATARDLFLGVVAPFHAPGGVYNLASCPSDKIEGDYAWFNQDKLMDYGVATGWYDELGKKLQSRNRVAQKKWLLLAGHTESPGQPVYWKTYTSYRDAARAYVEAVSTCT